MKVKEGMDIIKNDNPLMDTGQETIIAHDPIDLTRPVEIMQDIFWVGNHIENDPFQCHPYLIRNGNDSILVDPGSMLQVEKIVGKVRMICDLSDIHYIILHHQDPDLCAAVPDLEKLIGRDDLTIIAHSRMSVLIKHYGIKSGYFNIDQHDFRLSAGARNLRFYTTPYCHSPGSFVTFDEISKVLFSSDLFGGLEESWSLYAGDDYFKSIEGFHMSYMPSRDILNYALNKIQDLDISLIAPQHGSLIKKELIHPLIEQMKLMECGLYIDRKYSHDLLTTIGKLHDLQTEFEISLDEIKALKRRQDDDYFLTSLLMKPLIKNVNTSKDITTNFVIIQNKSFLYRGKHYQIGGDICITGNVVFRGMQHTFFFNGDAMGKSIQGAGGAIVIGTVLNSIINRSAESNRSLDIEPQKWLCSTYNDIQKLLLSFEGAMLVSGILGLVNDETGELFFVNAEHPFLVLYRNGKAVFVDSEMSLRKFGCSSESDFCCHRFQLEAGDILIAGSDGKDDLNLISGTSAAERNSDNQLFLSITEKAEGNLKKIVKSIFSMGDIPDDLSLLRIGYKETSPSAGGNQDLTDNFIYELKISNHIRNKNYQKALDLMEGASENQSPKILFYRGYCLIQEKRYLKALTYLERALEVRPGYFDALKYAGFAHYRLGNFTECKLFWERAREIRPHDSMLSKKYPELTKRLLRRKVLLGRKQKTD